MTSAKIAVSLDRKTLKTIDHLVKAGYYPSRSKAIQEALHEQLDRLKHGRLARECAKLDPVFEKSLAEEGLAGDLSGWPEY
ncbi:MAG: ribbon-helix-helix domain-containing protein [Thermodesulfobacteriota bacterium]